MISTAGQILITDNNPTEHHIKHMNYPFRYCTTLTSVSQNLFTSKWTLLDMKNFDTTKKTSAVHKIVKLSLALWLESVEWTGEGTKVKKCIKEILEEELSDGERNEELW